MVITENPHRPPPLKLVLTIQYDHKVAWLPYAHGGRVFIGTPEGVRAVERRVHSDETACNKQRDLREKVPVLGRITRLSVGRRAADPPGTPIESPSGNQRKRRTFVVTRSVYSCGAQ